MSILLENLGFATLSARNEHQKGSTRRSTPKLSLKLITVSILRLDETIVAIAALVDECYLTRIGIQEE